MDHVKQVGGNHYEGKVQHWDYCVRVQLQYLESAATKYIQRWRKKNGIQDLEKAISYLEKRIEAHFQMVGSLRGAIADEDLFDKYINDSKVAHEEAVLIFGIMHWRQIDELTVAIGMIRDLITEAEACEPGAGYVNQDR